MEKIIIPLPNYELNKKVYDFGFIIKDNEYRTKSVTIDRKKGRATIHAENITNIPKSIL